MAGVQLVEAVRGQFTPSQKLLAFPPPASSLPGDLLLAVVSHRAADGQAVLPSGWRRLGILGSGDDVLELLGGDVTDPVATRIDVPATGGEWLGVAVVLRGTSLPLVLEATAAAEFSTATALPTPQIASQQAPSLVLSTWTCAGTIALEPPTGFTSIDGFATSAVAPRSMLVAYRVAGATGLLTLPAAAAPAAVAGGAFSAVLRDRPPIAAPALMDLVPGNLGLIGFDTRPAR